MGPYFRDGQIVIKRAAGVAGDRVVVDPVQVRINGAVVGEGLALARTLGRSASAHLPATPSCRRSTCG